MVILHPDKRKLVARRGRPPPLAPQDPPLSLSMDIIQNKNNNKKTTNYFINLSKCFIEKYYIKHTHKTIGEHQT